MQLDRPAKGTAGIAGSSAGYRRDLSRQEVGSDCVWPSQRVGDYADEDRCPHSAISATGTPICVLDVAGLTEGRSRYARSRSCPRNVRSRLSSPVRYAPIPRGPRKPFPAAFHFVPAPKGCGSIASGRSTGIEGAMGAARENQGNETHCYHRHLHFQWNLRFFRDDPNPQPQRQGQATKNILIFPVRLPSLRKSLPSCEPCMGTASGPTM